MYAFAFLKSIPFHLVRDKNSNLQDLVSDAPLRGATSESIRLAQSSATVVLDNSVHLALASQWFKISPVTRIGSRVSIFAGWLIMIERRVATAAVIIGANCNASDRLYRAINIHWARMRSLLLDRRRCHRNCRRGQSMAVIYRPSAEMVSTDKDDNLWAMSYERSHTYDFFYFDYIYFEHIESATLNIFFAQRHNKNYLNDQLKC